MRIALVADLHGNRPATEALESDLAMTRPERIICLGDVVGKGPSSDFTFDWAVSHCEMILGGNWDYGVGFRQFSPDDFYWRQLGEKRLKALRALPREAEIWLSGRRLRLFHGRPTMAELVTIINPAEEIAPFLKDEEGKPFDGVVYADAHRQAYRTLSPGLFINTGSVGNALGVPQCCYALLEGEEGKARAPFEVRLRQLDYDREQAVRDAEKTPLVPRIDAYIKEIKTGVYSRKPVSL